MDWRELRGHDALSVPYALLPTWKLSYSSVLVVFQLFLGEASQNSIHEGRFR